MHIAEFYSLKHYLFYIFKKCMEHLRIKVYEYIFHLNILLKLYLKNRDQE